MKLNIKDQNGVILKTAKKYCKEDIEINLDTEELNILPSTEDQVNEGLYHKVSVPGEPNLAPENIAEDKELFGIKGTYKGTDTTDATATANDILEGKTAYVNKEKLEGTIGKYDGSYSGNADGSLVITDGYQLCYSGHRQEIAQQLIDMCGVITNADYMFYNCTKITKLDVGKLDTSQCTNMQYMFHGCENLTELDVSRWNTSNVKNMDRMFYNCKKITKLDLSNFDVSQCSNMDTMFCTMSKLVEIDVSKWDTSNVTDVGQLFMNNRAIVNLDLSNWDLGKVTYVKSMLGSMNSLTNLKSFKNLGKGYTRTTTNYSGYQFEHYNTAITKESLVDLINNGLYDLNLTYDVANGGTLYRQQFTIGSPNMAKLTEEEIQIAIDKGWNVS